MCHIAKREQKVNLIILISQVIEKKRSRKNKIDFAKGMYKQDFSLKKLGARIKPIFFGIKLMIQCSTVNSGIEDRLLFNICDFRNSLVFEFLPVFIK